MKKILTVVGARPQFIKASAISRTIRTKHSSEIQEDILHTGQHYDNAMSGQFFTELDIPLPKYNLGVGSGHHGRQTALMMSGIEEILMDNPYDGVLVYGDTNSTLAGALAAAKLHIPVYHVEAGLRSFNHDMPEEINRVVADHVSTLLFAPTQTAVQNLRNEGFEENKTIFSGDVMYDNMLHYSHLALQKTRPILDSYILATLHRDFNTDNPDRLKHILSVLNNITNRFDIPIVFPMHPRTHKCVDSMGNTPLSSNIHVIEPLSYLETLAALQRCSLVLTDSGGLQKEANFCRKYCVVLRPETEWVELVNDGTAVLTDADEAKIIDATGRLLGKTPITSPHFGKGTAAKTIIGTILAR